MNNKPHINLCTTDGHLGSFQHLATANNAVVIILLWVFGIDMYAFLMRVYIQRCDCWVLGVYAQFWELQTKIFYPSFWNNCIGGSLLLADECNITFHCHFSPKRLRQESDQELQSVSTWLCPVCSSQV